ncbi:hypothetical protein BV372_08160 [Nostoc sp. T09]|nr:hypothetical protein BV372_08160 [Nostoc sp. T09]
MITMFRNDYKKKGRGAYHAIVYGRGEKLRAKNIFWRWYVPLEHRGGAYYRGTRMFNKRQITY